jgi:hypothetical protein
MSEHEGTDIDTNRLRDRESIRATTANGPTAAAMTDAVNRRRMHGQRPVANPDDPPVQRPPYGPRGPHPGPYDSGSPGRMAIVQGQVLILAVIVVAQLWLITTALFELLSGRTAGLGWLALASGVGFAIGLLVWWWPRRRIHES